MRIIFALLLSSFLCSSSLALENSVSTRFQTAGIGYDDAKTFYSKLQDSTINNKKKLVVKLLEYPFGTKIDGKVINIKNQYECLKYYDEIFTKKVISSIRDTSFEDLEVFYTGVSTKDGVVWFGGTRIRGKKGFVNVVRVIAINN